ncbi:MAG TPA: WD40 repeat domain-containing protein, partial [candidate division Zixibacteria bacterium]|nr:WD40 repeat domain-containing protein [candidate division Zixibacteria bacterium]
MIQSRRVRRGRLIVAGLTVGLVLAIILSAFALSQRSSAIAESEARATQQAIAETERAHAEDAAAEINRQKSQIEIQARDSLARNLASYAHDNLNSDPQLSLLLALEAANQTYLANGTILPEAQAALQRSIQEVSRLSFTIPSQSIGQPYISFSPDGSSVIARYFRSGTDPRALSSETSTLIWDATTGELLHALPPGVAVDAWPVTPYIGIIDLAEDEIILNLWNPSDGKSRPPINLSIPESLEAEDLTDVVLSPDAARLIAFWLEGRIVQIWDLESITQTHSLSLPRRPADGQVSSTLGGDGFFKVGVPSNATISADGRRMYILAPKLFLSPGERRQRLTVHTLESAEELRALDVTTLELGPLNSSLSISPDERFSGIVAEEYVEIRDFETGEMLNIQTNSPDTNFNALSFSPDGTMLAAADVDGIIKVWDVG